jgi:precorrin-2 methylase
LLGASSAELQVALKELRTTVIVVRQSEEAVEEVENVSWRRIQQQVTWKRACHCDARIYVVRRAKTPSDWFSKIFRTPSTAIAT